MVKRTDNRVYCLPGLLVRSECLGLKLGRNLELGGEIVPTHGSLSKAGKVRMQTPKIEQTSKKSTAGPRVKNRKLYHYRVELCRNIGQFKMDSYRRR